MLETNHSRSDSTEGCMTLTENKAVVRRFYEEVHGGNLEALDELVADEILVHGWSSEGRYSPCHTGLQRGK